MTMLKWFATKGDAANGSSEKHVEESSLLGLPAEIRDMIWRFAMSGRVLHLTSGEEATRQPRTGRSLYLKREKGRAKVVRCHGFVDCSKFDFQSMVELRPQNPTSGIVRGGKRWTNWGGWHCNNCGQFFDHWDFGEWLPIMEVTEIDEGDALPKDYLIRKRSKDDWNPLELLQTCRMTYREALPHLYNGNHFQLRTHQQAVDWPSTLLPSTRNLITSIHVPIRIKWHTDFGLYDLQETLTSLSKLKGLRNVEIELMYQNLTYIAHDWKQNLKELLELVYVVRKNKGQVLLGVPWIHNTAEVEHIEGLTVVKGPKELYGG